MGAIGHHRRPFPGRREVSPESPAGPFGAIKRSRKTSRRRAQFAGRCRPCEFPGPCCRICPSRRPRRGPVPRRSRRDRRAGRADCAMGDFPARKPGIPAHHRVTPEVGRKDVQQPRDRARLEVLAAGRTLVCRPVRRQVGTHPQTISPDREQKFDKMPGTVISRSRRSIWDSQRQLSHPARIYHRRLLQTALPAEITAGSFRRSGLSA